MARSRIRGVFAFLAAALPCVTGCTTASYEYVRSARADIAAMPSPAGPIPTRSGNTFALSGRLQRVSGDHLHSDITSGPFLAPMTGTYVAATAPTNVGADARLIFRPNGGDGNLPVLFDLFTSWNSDVREPLERHAGLFGFGLTVPAGPALFRLAPSLGRHRYRLRMEEVRVTGSCAEDACAVDVSPRDDRPAAPLFTWSAAAWLPRPGLSPYVGYHYGRMYVLSEKHWVESFTLRRISVEAGALLETRHGFLTAGVAHEGLRHRSREEVSLSVRVEAGRAFSLGR